MSYYKHCKEHTHTQTHSHKTHPHLGEYYYTGSIHCEIYFYAGSIHCENYKNGKNETVGSRADAHLKCKWTFPNSAPKWLQKFTQQYFQSACFSISFGQAHSFLPFPLNVIFLITNMGDHLYCQNFIGSLCFFCETAHLYALPLKIVLCLFFLMYRGFYTIRILIFLYLLPIWQTFLCHLALHFIIGCYYYRS